VLLLGGDVIMLSWKVSSLKNAVVTSYRDDLGKM